MSNPKHTPGPWRTEWAKERGNNNVVACRGRGSVAHIAARGNRPRDIEEMANAAFIVRACNSHYELVGLLQEIDDWGYPDQWWELEDDRQCLAERINKALVAAGESHE